MTLNGFVRVVGVLCVWAAVAGADNVLVADFESEEVVGRWLSRFPQKDRRTVDFGWSTAHASRGKGSLRIDFPKHEPDMPTWQIVQGDIDRKGFTVFDWSGHDTLSMDIYNPHDSERYLRFSFEDIDRKRYGARGYLQPGWNRVRFSIDAMREDGLKTQQMNTIWFVLHVPKEQTTVFVDNIQLEDLTQARLSLIEGQLDILQRCASWLDANERQNIVAKVRELSERLDRDKGDPDKVADVQQQCAALLDTYRDPVTSVLFDAGMGLYPAQPKQTSIVPMVDGKPVRTAFGSANPNTVSGRFDRLAGQAALQSRLKEYNAGPLVVGVQNDYDPAKLVYRPQVFDESLGGKVELYAAAGEAESACLMLIPTAGPLSGVTWSAGALSQPGNDTPVIPAHHVQVQPLGYRQASPLEPAQAWIIRHDIDKVDIPGDAQQALWVTIRAPGNAAAGTYEGTITIRAEGIEPVHVRVEYTVWPFALPETIHMPVVCNYVLSEQADALVMQYRVNASGIYTWPGPSKIEQIRRWVRGGSRQVNLMRISKFALKSSFVRDENGRMTVADTEVKQNILKRLGNIVPQLKEEGLLDYCYVYGFDEPGSGLITAMEDIYGEIKEQFGLKTMFCTLNPVWEQHPRIHNVDRWSVQANYLTPERARAIRDQGIEVWGHNQHQGFPIGRMQYWSAYRLGLDGMLQYGLRAGGPVHDPMSFPVEAGPVGGVMLRVDNKERHYNGTTGYATLEFAQWRDGSEDVEYLVLLQQLIDTAKGLAPTDVPQLLGEAAYWVNVPDYIAPPYHDRTSPDWEPLTANHIRYVRHRLAELIVELGRLVD